MANNFENVCSFMQKIGQKINPVGHKPTDREVYLRLKLILEEVAETCRDAGYDIELWAKKVDDEKEDTLIVFNYQGLPAYDPIAIFDGLCDILVVTYGSGATFGLPLNSGMWEVHNSNCSKSNADGSFSFRDDGKLIKGINYIPANFYSVFETHKAVTGYGAKLWDTVQEQDE